MYVFKYLGSLIPKMTSKFSYCQWFGRYLQIFDKMVVNYTLFKCIALATSTATCNKETHFETVKKTLKKANPMQKNT